MKRIIAAAALTLFTAGIALAADTMTFPAKMGDVTFNHKMHQDLLKDCKKCHATDAGGKIEGFGKDAAHKLCKGCHTDMGKGPTKCGDCHKK
ncbi:MAG TPA: cytochrome c7 [Geobacteraceae bacterium]|jgi:predicted CXXCH cytochrome family protein|nr:cytochrome c7 [Geobacteraceae bacterium]